MSRESHQHTELTASQPATQTQALTVLQPAGGMGLDLGSKYLAIKPDTIQINQPSTTVENAIRGHLRLSSTGTQYKELHLVLLDTPTESRSYHVGEPGTLHRTPENLLCFSRDMVRPDRQAKVPQAQTCAGCVRGNWDAYRKEPIKENIPPCEVTLRALFIDTDLDIPLQMYIRSKSKKAFEAGVQTIARKLQMLKGQMPPGQLPNIFDIGFTLSTKPIVTGKMTSYVTHLSDFRVITPEERVRFTEAYLQYKAAQENASDGRAEAAASGQVDSVETSIDTAMVDPGYVIDGEIVI